VKLNPSPTHSLTMDEVWFRDDKGRCVTRTGEVYHCNDGVCHHVKTLGGEIITLLGDLFCTNNHIQLRLLLDMCMHQGGELRCERCGVTGANEYEWQTGRLYCSEKCRDSDGMVAKLAPPDVPVMMLNPANGRGGGNNSK